MVRTLLRVAVVGCFPLCFIGLGFQVFSPDGPSAASPRIHSAPKEVLPASSIRVESALVEVPVHVTNTLGANVAGLVRADFELSEDGIKQPITYFSMGDAPTSVGLVYDSSASMRGKMEQEAAAAKAFMRTANPGDEFFLVEFGERPKLATRFTVWPEDIVRRISRTRPFGRTPLLDAIFLAMTQMKSAHNSRKALVILSDGGDNQSRRNARQIKSRLAEADLQLYAMGIYGSTDSRKLSSEEKRGPKLLTDLAEETGGRMFPVNRAEDLPEISTRISHELRTQYVLGYSPQSNHDGKYHRITVKIHRTDMRIQNRQGYYASQ